MAYAKHIFTFRFSKDFTMKGMKSMKKKPDARFDPFMFFMSFMVLCTPSFQRGVWERIPQPFISN